MKRKNFVAVLAAAGAVVGSVAEPVSAPAASAPADDAAANASPEIAAASPHATTNPHSKALDLEPEAYIYFTAPEAAFVEAAVERLIPRDGLGPGARDAGVAYFIDQQLTGQFGYGAKMYMAGPWAQGTKTQGYQLPLTPRDVYRLGIAEADAYCVKTLGKPFAELSGKNQDDVLGALEHAKVEFESVPASTFFEMLYANTVEGFFADPIYGGNRDKAGWKLVGFPGVAAAYISLIERHNVAYKVAPVGIGDVEQMSGMREDHRQDEHHQLVYHLARGQKVEA